MFLHLFSTPFIILLSDWSTFFTSNSSGLHLPPSLFCFTSTTLQASLCCPALVDSHSQYELRSGHLCPPCAFQVYQHSFLASYLIYNLYTRWEKSEFNIFFANTPKRQRNLINAPSSRENESSGNSRATLSQPWRYLFKSYLWCMSVLYTLYSVSFMIWKEY